MKRVYPYLCRPENDLYRQFLEVWIGSSVGQNAALSRRRSRVRVPSGPLRPLSNNNLRVFLCVSHTILTHLRSFLVICSQNIYPYQVMWNHTNKPTHPPIRSASYAKTAFYPIGKIVERFQAESDGLEVFVNIYIHKG